MQYKQMIKELENEGISVRFRHYRYFRSMIGWNYVGWLNRYYRHQPNPFAPTEKGGKTICTIFDSQEGVLAEASAICSCQDNFCYATGRQIALGRAYKWYAEQMEGVSG